MKLARLGPRGAERPAIVTDDGERYIDVSEAFSDFDSEFLASGGLTRLASWLDDREGDVPTHAIAGQRYGAPVHRPGKIICVGLNYRDHANESGMELPEEPILFGKASSAMCGPYDDILLPPGASKVDWEVELGVVVGRTARYLESPNEGLDCIGGYCLVNDVSERAYQLERGGQWIKGKSAENFNPAGPWLVTPDEIPDISNVGLTLTVNSETMQKGNTSDMVFDSAFLVYYISQFMVLEPGDLINTGTPAGVGMGSTPPRYLSEGDTVILEADHLGRQLQHCRQAYAS